MLQIYAHQKKLHETQLITDDTNCSPFESEVIVEKAKKVFAISDHAEGNVLQPGRMIRTVPDMNEQIGQGGLSFDDIPF